MNKPFHSRHRLSSRRRSRGRRGLTVFIVLLVIGMLFAVGTFAAKMASSGVANSGRFRQMQQTHYLSEMGLQATLSELQRDPNGYRILLANAQPIAPPEYPCKDVPNGLPVPPADVKCVRIGYGAVQNASRVVTGQSALNILEPKTSAGLGGPPGSLGRGNMQGNFGSELTELIEEDPPAGFPQDPTAPLVFYRVTILSTGQVLPYNPATNAPFAKGTPEFTLGISQEETRAHVLFGPVPK